MRFENLNKEILIKILLSLNIGFYCLFSFFNYDDVLEPKNSVNYLTNPNILIFFDFLFQNFSSTIRKLISFVIIPLFTSYFLFKIFNKYLNVFWSSIFTFIGIFSNEDVPFREFLKDFFVTEIFNNNYIINYEIFVFPFPSISFLIFLFLFNSIISQIRLNSLKVVLYSLGWMILSEISFYDGLLGIIFWISFIIVDFLKYKKQKNQLLFTLILIIGLITYQFLKISDFPLYYLSNNLIDWEYLIYHFVCYLLLPIFFMIVANYAVKVDIYEILIKFSNIIILIISENLLILFIAFFTNFDVREFDSGVQMIFVHFYFFVPSLYFLNRSFISFHGLSAIKNYVYYSKRFIFLSFNYILYFISMIFYFLFNFYMVSSLNI